MASEHPTSAAVPEDVPADKGKGKQVEDTATDTAMDEDDDSSSSDEGEDVSSSLHPENPAQTARRQPPKLTHVPRTTRTVRPGNPRRVRQSAPQANNKTQKPPPTMTTTAWRRST